jgi:hypothetical protein
MRIEMKLGDVVQFGAGEAPIRQVRCAKGSGHGTFRVRGDGGAREGRLNRRCRPPVPLIASADTIRAMSFGHGNKLLADGTIYKADHSHVLMNDPPADLGGWLCYNWVT